MITIAKTVMIIIMMLTVMILAKTITMVMRFRAMEVNLLRSNFTTREVNSREKQFFSHNSAPRARIWATLRWREPLGLPELPIQLRDLNS